METVKDKRTTNGTSATAHTINTPRGCFEVSATYRTREEAKEKNAAENFGRCKRIADELSELAAGRLCVCPHCGGIHNPEEMEKTENEDGETVYTCPECGEELEEDEAEQATAADYFAEALAFDFITDANKEYKGARVLVAWGGPSISIDTECGAVVLNWWGETARAFMSSDAVDLVDDFARELFEMR